MEKLFGLYSGTIINRTDPEGLGRIKVAVPGIIEPGNAEESPWAYPKGGGSKKWGNNDVPPLNADVYIQFLSGDIAHPIWEPGWHGKPIVDGVQETEAFPELKIQMCQYLVAVLSG